MSTLVSGYSRTGQPGLPKDTLAKVEKELKTLKAGNRGESDSAYHIDFYYREKPNWAVIHDLRIEYGGNVAQIDHLHKRI